MLLTTTSQNLSPSPFLNPPLKPFTTTTMRTPLSLLRSLFHHHHLSRLPSTSLLRLPPTRALNSLGQSIEHLQSGNAENLENGERGSSVGYFERDYKHLEVGEEVEVKELEELPEQWRRSRLAWLCKELPSHKAGTLVRILNGQKKWMRQDDSTYVVVHCTRIRENEAAFQVYKWMQQQNWYRFDFALATKLADYLGKERKFAKCRKIFDDILNQGRVPSESTFHILIVAYLSAPVQGCLEEACGIYNRMIQLGGYQPRLSLHNSLFRALISKPGGNAKHYLKQAEFVYHNLVTSGLEIQKDIFSGLIWLHSYQDTVDKDRIISLREEMKQARIQEDTEVLLSVLRACSKNGDVEDGERTWIKLLDMNDHLHSQAFVYRMEVFAKAGQPTKSLEIFGDMEKHLGTHSPTAYHKIIEIMCKANEMNIAEQLMQDFIVSGMNPLTPSFIDLMNMYFKSSMHDKLEFAFSTCLKKCRPNRSVYNIYLESLLQVGNIEKAEAIFNHMCSDDMVGVNNKSCNTILSGYLSSGEHVKAENIYDLMRRKKFDVDSSLMEKLDFVLSLRRKDIKKPVSIKLSKEQREILMGLLIGGVKIESDEERKKHMIRFEFNENSGTHSVLRRHLYDQYHEWLHPSCKPTDENEDVPDRFATISHSYFSFFADQFWPRGRPVIPKLIHRWLSPRVLAYWYMYGGYKTSSGDILLKVKGSSEGVGRIAKALKAKSLEFRVKKKGRVYWFGFLGTSSTWFWKLIEPFVLEDLRDFVKADSQTTENYSAETREDVNFDSGSDFDENASEHNDSDSS